MESIRTISFNNNDTLVCITLIEKNNQDYINALSDIKDKKYDLIEIRLDAYEYINNKDKVISLLKTIRQADHTPILTTIRSKNEGGYSDINNDYYYELYTYIIDNKCAELIDLELFKDKINNYTLIDYAHQHNIKVIMSYHNFECTPEVSNLYDYAHSMEVLGADAVKLALMPRCKEDVISLINVCIKLSSSLTLPVICISMSSMGKITRVLGALMGNAMTYVCNDKEGRFGQVSIDDIHQYLDLLKESDNEK